MFDRDTDKLDAIAWRSLCLAWQNWAYEIFFELGQVNYSDQKAREKISQAIHMGKEPYQSTKDG